MEDISDGRCWICLSLESVPNRSLAVDHDHETGQIRGLLCTRCNQSIGRMGDDWRVMRRAYLYLRRAWNQWCDNCRVCGTTNVPILQRGSLESRDGIRFVYNCSGCGKQYATRWDTTGTRMQSVAGWFACWVPEGAEVIAEVQCTDPTADDRPVVISSACDARCE